jgi:phosphoribosylaminoimidazole-succinocarboxamide synthase
MLSALPGARQVLPEAPAELVAELSRRYILLYERITGEGFRPPELGEDPLRRMAANVGRALRGPPAE